MLRARLVLPLDGRDDIARALAQLTAWNRTFLERHPRTQRLYASGVRYRREEISAGRRLEDWLTIPDLYRRRFGDCEDLACARAAEVPGAIALPRPVPGGWHIIVRLPGGRFEDPSKRLGM